MRRYTRSFEQAELKLLLDAVGSSRFITQKKSQILSEKLIALSSIHEQNNLQRFVYATNRIKASNESLLYVVDTANEAIGKKLKITFQYTDYSSAKEKALRNNGEIYTLRPYALFWNEDYYCVVGWSDKHENISSFRADRIVHIELTEEEAVNQPKDFDVEKYSRKIFEMYDGETLKVKLQCKNDLMRYIVDRFGEDVETSPATDDIFYATTEVSLSPNLYSWIFKFNGDIRILSPGKAVNGITTMAQNLLK